MKVQFEMEREQFEKVLQMVYLGEYVIKSCSCAEEGKAYGDIADLLYAKRYSAEYGLPEYEAEENEIADMRDRLYDKSHKYLEAFEADIFKENTALCEGGV